MPNHYSSVNRPKREDVTYPGQPRYTPRPNLPQQPSPVYSTQSAQSLATNVTGYIPSQDARSVPYQIGPTYNYTPSPSLQYVPPQPPDLHYFPPPLGQHESERSRPALSLELPPASFPYDPTNIARLPHGYASQISPRRLDDNDANSPYLTPFAAVTSESASTSGVTDYFPAFGTPILAHDSISPSWNTPQVGVTKASRRDAGAKTSRQQFTACGACRHRRVKCDLKDRQDQAENLQGMEEKASGPVSHRSPAPSVKRRKVSCTNCQERGTNCVDEYAPLKAAKQLRRGKRISEIEMLYGSTATNAAVASRTEEIPVEGSVSPSRARETLGLPDLTRSFFQSPFFRRFQVQRPIIDPVEFVSRYLAASPPSAAAMGTDGSILCHVLYAWALSYGVDETGVLDVEEGGESPDGPIDLVTQSVGEVKREHDRMARKAKMEVALRYILKEIDEAGILRKPSWDGVRALLMILPLTDGVSSPVERLAMYEAAISQVFTLCSFIGLGYDGAPSAFSGVNGGTDQSGAHNMHAVRIRIYWYAFVHEGITTGLKGGRLHLDDEDLETMQDSVDNRALVSGSSSFRSSAKFATAPINLALACRLINKALTGPAAKRRRHVSAEAVEQAWEALEACWEEFEALQHVPFGQTPYATEDEVIRFSDGWKIFLFEAQNVILKSLEQRLADLTGEGSAARAHILDSGVDPSAAAINISRLIEISRSKCEVKTRQIFDIVRRHVGSRFFEWDASLVRDGTYYAAMLHARAGGDEQDIAMCIRALHEMRWAHAKACERSETLRKECAANRRLVSVQGWNPTPPETTYYDITAANAYATLDGSLSNDSADTSPGNASLIDQPSASLGTGPLLNPTIYAVPAPGTVYPVYAPPVGPPPLYNQAPGAEFEHAAPVGRYVLQPDGSQVYIPYG